MFSTHAVHEMANVLISVSFRIYQFALTLFFLKNITSAKN